ncbi:maleylpyruvate isomerase family mycothiol-dependent enzyme [Actinoplanes sp. NPDC051861]|uniref:maleylpyruvate isomerase family mycothiol-dependent enzyme n=1 Tax=Actinoplanes sp. NPDC051861 TaxID=3155170 RepID=UPI00341DFF83
MRAHIEGERTDLAGMLAALTPDQWDAPTLCDGWRVREVVAHMTLPFRTSTARFLVEMLKAGGRMNRMIDRTAARDAAGMTSEELLASLRDNIAHPWTPPGGGAAGALSHDVIHGLDISVALGLDRRVPLDRLRVVLGGMTAKSVAYFGAGLDGVSLRATDLDWTFGEGAPVRGAAQDLLLVVCGRKLPPGLLSGADAGRFSRVTTQWAP